jgi:bifunctional DNase/RNase/DNA-binding transcriptional MerR regulator
VSASEDKRWKVGELAQATGATVRALHHYDELGLLVPSERTGAGHRLYAEGDVRRLYELLALRRLGLPLDEIAEVLDGGRLTLTETVRRHLERVEHDLAHQQRLRRHLAHILDALERSVEPPVDQFIDAMEAMTMIETTLEDVLVAVPSEALGSDPPPLLAREGSRVVLIKERDGERVLPIWTGQEGGDALALRMRGAVHPRPLGPDLTAQLLEAAGARVERVVIEDLSENTYYATVRVTVAGESHEVDARPTDAINLAARVGAPIVVDPQVMDAVGVDATELEAQLSKAAADLAGVTGSRDEWRSVTPELYRSLYPLPKPEQ